MSELAKTAIRYLDKVEKLIEDYKQQPGIKDTHLDGTLNTMLAQVCNSTSHFVGQIFPVLYKGGIITSEEVNKFQSKLGAKTRRG